MAAEANQPKDLVLISGLINLHRWGKNFLQTLANIWGSEHVYIIYTNEGTKVKKLQFHNQIIYAIGPNNFRSGSQSIEAQALQVEKKVRILQSEYGLGEHFHIIAHSMGGLVSRQYIYNHPNTVANLVTLGTPHHGSPLARFYKWLSYFIGAKNAFANLTPEWVGRFNAQYPIENAPLWNNGKIYTVRGYASKHPLKNFGVIGEVLYAWLTLRFVCKTNSDGLVPEDSAVIQGSEHLADFHECSHFDLVRRPSVAKKASAVLIGSKADKQGIIQTIQ